jgi:Ras-related protein Rab-11A
MDLKIQEVDGSESEDYSFKIVVVGDSGVGKSNILNRYVHNEFNHDSKATVGVELNTKSYKINDKIVKVHIWDTAGQERYKSITAAYYKGAKGAMIVYDITKLETFKSVDKWYKEIIEYGDKMLIPMMVGNKCDLKHLRAVETNVALERARSLNIPFMETSAAEATNVELSFQKLINGTKSLI